MTPPKDARVILKETATFSCTTIPASNVIGIYYITNVDQSNWTSRGISQSAQTYSGNTTTKNLTVLGTMANNGLLITCRVVALTSEYMYMYVVDIQSAQLTIEGLC